MSEKNQFYSACSVCSVCSVCSTYSLNANCKTVRLPPQPSYFPLFVIAWRAFAHSGRFIYASTGSADSAHNQTASEVCSVQRTVDFEYLLADKHIDLIAMLLPHMKNQCPDSVAVLLSTMYIPLPK